MSASSSVMALLVIDRRTLSTSRTDRISVATFSRAESSATTSSMAWIRSALDSTTSQAWAASWRPDASAEAGSRTAGRARASSPGRRATKVRPRLLTGWTPIHSRLSLASWCTSREVPPPGSAPASTRHEQRDGTMNAAWGHPRAWRGSGAAVLSTACGPSSVACRREASACSIVAVPARSEALGSAANDSMSDGVMSSVSCSGIVLPLVMRRCCGCVVGPGFRGVPGTRGSGSGARGRFTCR